MIAPLDNRLRELRRQRGWSQAELAARAGLSRSGVSAIEKDALVPSTVAALALARALDVRVEDLFCLRAAPRRDAEWVFAPVAPGAPCWRAEVDGRRLLFPVERTLAGDLPHDDGESVETVVVAGCDPAVGLLSAALAREARIRLLPLTRSSKAALELLDRGVVHLAGVHLGDNERAVRESVGPGHVLVRVATWEAGLGLQPGLRLRSVRGAVHANLRWVGREPGSGARRCMDRVLADVARRPRGVQHVARDHLAVAATVASGWAQVGVCVRSAAVQAGLDFLTVENEAFELCTTAALAEDPKVKALVRALRSPFFRRQASAVPGYDVSQAGETRTVR